MPGAHRRAILPVLGVLKLCNPVPNAASHIPGYSGPRPVGLCCVRETVWSASEIPSGTSLIAIRVNLKASRFGKCGSDAGLRQLFLSLFQRVPALARYSWAGRASGETGEEYVVRELGRLAQCRYFRCATRAAFLWKRVQRWHCWEAGGRRYDHERTNLIQPVFGRDFHRRWRYNRQGRHGYQRDLSVNIELASKCCAN